MLWPLTVDLEQSPAVPAASLRWWTGTAFPGPTMNSPANDPTAASAARPSGRPRAPAPAGARSRVTFRNELVLMSKGNVRLGGCSHLRMWCSSRALILHWRRAFGQSLFADVVSVDGRCLSDCPGGKCSELGLPHMLPQGPLTRSEYSVLLRLGSERYQVRVLLACFQLRQVGDRKGEAQSDVPSSN